jgi:hypothetical protein
MKAASRRRSANCCANAHSIITSVDLLKARAKEMTAGLEPELSVVVDPRIAGRVLATNRRGARGVPGKDRMSYPSISLPLSLIRADPTTSPSSPSCSIWSQSDSGNSRSHARQSKL